MGTGVYFLRNDANGAIKIGMSRRPVTRIGSIKTASTDPITVLGVIEGDRQVEAALHREFAHLKLKGEWFRGAPELLSHIAKISRPLADFAGSPREQDAHTKQAAKWVADMVERHAADAKITRKAARAELAELAGLSPNVLLNLESGRLAEITASAYCAIYQLRTLVLTETVTAYCKEIVNLKQQERRKATEPATCPPKPEGRLGWDDSWAKSPGGS